MKLLFKFMVLAVAVSLPGGAQSLSVMRYDAPATCFDDALPLGNGHIGVMLYGGTSEARFGLNEATLWGGIPAVNTVEDGPAKLAAIREALARGDRNEADRITRTLEGKNAQSFVTMGDLMIWQPLKAASAYRRELDLGTAVCRESFLQNGVEYTRESFVSYPARALVVRLEASRPGALVFDAGGTTPWPDTYAESVSDSEIAVGSQLGRYMGTSYARHPHEWTDGNGAKGMRFQFRVKVASTDGRCSVRGGRLHVEGASMAVLLLTAATSYNGPWKDPDKDGLDEKTLCAEAMKAIDGKDYDLLKKEHVADFSLLFSRVKLCLGCGSDDAALTVPQRLEAYKAGAADPALEELYFNFGRYLLLSCSRPDGPPANLQGIWCGDTRPSWGCDYTTNINLEMNYWAAEPLAMQETAEALFSFLGYASLNGAEVARNVYGMKGWVMHHNSDIWGNCVPVGETMGQNRWSMWPMAGGWLCRHLYDHYLYGGDIGFLRDKAYPLMKGAAEFYEDWVIRRGGRYLTSPSTSPENNYKDENGKVHDVMENSAMDREILSDLLGNVIEASRILKTDARSRARWRRIRAGLAPLEIGERGNIVEWDRDFADKDAHHRHISHLYALYPSNEISPSGTPELAEAARRTMEIRGETGPGWSMVWKMACYARLLDAETAHTMLRNQLCKATSPTLLDIYPPFQIDANLGALAGYTEMLLQDAYEQLHLLPAVPSGWADGSVSGMRARGGYTVDMTWRGGRLQEAVIKASSKGRCTLLTSVPVRIEGRRARTVKGASGYVTRFKTVPDGSYAVFSD
jgi:alpha-L-fucosidase 2